MGERPYRMRLADLLAKLEQIRADYGPHIEVYVVEYQDTSGHRRATKVDVTEFQGDGPYIVVIE